TTTIERQPQQGACDQSKQKIETDGWYIDLPKGTATPPDTGNETTVAASTCHDEITATSTGDAKLLGFPLSYTTTITQPKEDPVVVSMEVTAFDVTSLDNALSDI